MFKWATFREIFLASSGNVNDYVAYLNIALLNILVHDVINLLYYNILLVVVVNLLRRSTREGMITWQK